MGFKEQLEGQKRRQALWQKYCARNEPMPRDELPSGVAPRGNRVLKAKDQADKRKFPAMSWWEWPEWEVMCDNLKRDLKAHQPKDYDELVDEIFQLNMGERKRKKRK